MECPKCKHQIYLKLTLEDIVFCPYCDQRMVERKPDEIDALSAGVEPVRSLLESTEEAARPAVQEPAEAEKPPETICTPSAEEMPLQDLEQPQQGYSEHEEAVEAAYMPSVEEVPLQDMEQPQQGYGEHEEPVEAACTPSVEMMPLQDVQEPQPAPGDQEEPPESGAAPCSADVLPPALEETPVKREIIEPLPERDRTYFPVQSVNEEPTAGGQECSQISEPPPCAEELPEITQADTAALTAREQPAEPMVLEGVCQPVMQRPPVEEAAPGIETVSAAEEPAPPAGSEQSPPSSSQCYETAAGPSEEPDIASMPSEANVVPAVEETPPAAAREPAAMQEDISRPVKEAPGAGKAAFCVRCGQKLAQDYVFCPRCGESFGPRPATAPRREEAIKPVVRAAPTAPKPTESKVKAAPEKTPPDRQNRKAPVISASAQAQRTLMREDISDVMGDSAPYLPSFRREKAAPGTGAASAWINIREWWAKALSGAGAFADEQRRKLKRNRVEESSLPPGVIPPARTMRSRQRAGIRPQDQNMQYVYWIVAGLVIVAFFVIVGILMTR